MAGLGGKGQQGSEICMFNQLPSGFLSSLSHLLEHLTPQESPGGPSVNSTLTWLLPPLHWEKHFPRVSVSPPTHPTHFLGWEGRSGQGRAGQGCRDQLGCVCFGGFPLWLLF